MAREAGHVATSCAARIANASTAVSNRQPVASRLAWFYADTDLRSIPGPCHPDPSAAPLPRRPPPANGESLKFGCKATGNLVYSLAWPPDPAHRRAIRRPISVKRADQRRRATSRGPSQTSTYLLAYLLTVVRYGMVRRREDGKGGCRGVLAR